MITGICSDCGLEKNDITRHGDCFKCHMRSISVGQKKPCKTCGPDAFRTSQNVTTKRTTKEL